MTGSTRGRCPRCEPHSPTAYRKKWRTCRSHTLEQGGSLPWPASAPCGAIYMGLKAHRRGCLNTNMIQDR